MSVLLTLLGGSLIVTTTLLGHYAEPEFYKNAFAGLATFNIILGVISVMAALSQAVYE